MGTDVGTARANLKWQSSDKHSARIGSLHNYDNHSEISEIMSFTIIYKHALSSFGPCWATSNHQISNRMQRRKRRELLLPCHALAYSLIVWWVLSSACKRWQTRSTLWFCTLTPHIICPYYINIAHRRRKSRWAPHKSVSRVSRSNDMTIQSLRLVMSCQAVDCRVISVSKPGKVLSRICELGHMHRSEISKQQK